MELTKFSKQQQSRQGKEILIQEILQLKSAKHPPEGTLLERNQMVHYYIVIIIT